MVQKTSTVISSSSERCRGCCPKGQQVVKTIADGELFMFKTITIKTKTAKKKQFYQGYIIIRFSWWKSSKEYFPFFRNTETEAMRDAQYLKERVEMEL